MAKKAKRKAKDDSGSSGTRIKKQKQKQKTHRRSVSLQESLPFMSEYATFRPRPPGAAAPTYNPFVVAGPDLSGGMSRRNNKGGSSLAVMSSTGSGTATATKTRTDSGSGDANTRSIFALRGPSSPSYGRSDSRRKNKKHNKLSMHSDDGGASVSEIARKVRRAKPRGTASGTTEWTEKTEKTGTKENSGSDSMTDARRTMQLTARLTGMMTTGALSTKTKTKSKSSKSSSDKGKRTKWSPKTADLREIMKNYIVKDKIYQGQDTAVYTAYAKENRKKLLVIKFIEDSRLNEDEPPREAQMLETLRGHPCIPDLREWVPFYKSGCYAVVLPFIDGEPVRGLEPNVTRKYMWDLLHALAFCHRKGIIYRDVKPENILFERKKQRATLVDYDLAIFYDPSKPPTSHSGTEGYLAPEVAGKERKHGYDHKVDSYSAGVVFFEQLFQVKRTGVLTEAKMTKSLAKVRRPTSAHGLLARMLDPNPRSRISCAEALHHPYFTGHAITRVWRELDFPDESGAESDIEEEEVTTD